MSNDTCVSHRAFVSALERVERERRDAARGSHVCHAAQAARVRERVRLRVRVHVLRATALRVRHMKCARRVTRQTVETAESCVRASAVPLPLPQALWLSCALAFN